MERELKGQGDISENKGYNSLSKVERIALKETNNCTDTIITKVHKEGAVIIIDIILMKPTVNKTTKITTRN